MKGFTTYLKRWAGAAWLLLLAGAIMGSLQGCTEAGPEIEETEPPSIISFTPTSGPPGTIVIITGSNFGATITGNDVKFNGRTSPISSASTTELTVSVPAGATTGKVEVTVKKRTATSEEDFTVQ